MSRVLVACVGNVLRGDDGFGVAVADELAGGEPLPAGVEVIETGIGGLSIVQQLMDGYDCLIVVDAIARGAAPGTVVVAEPHVHDPQTMSAEEWRTQFSNLHLAEPSRVLLMARAAGVLPRRVILVGCEPLACDDYAASLSPTVQAAIPVAVNKIRELVAMPGATQVG